MLIVVKVLSGENKTLELAMDKKSTVRDLKQAIADLIKMPVPEQRLVLRNDVLADASTLKKCKIDSNIIYLSRKTKPFAHKPLNALEMNNNKKSLQLSELGIDTIIYNDQAKVNSEAPNSGGSSSKDFEHLMKEANIPKDSLMVDLAITLPKTIEDSDHEEILRRVSDLLLEIVSPKLLPVHYIKKGAAYCRKVVAFLKLTNLGSGRDKISVLSVNQPVKTKTDIKKSDLLYNNFRKITPIGFGRPHSVFDFIRY